jgi:glucosamine--fructose-6-phosphate aminotransferase (isomerizing)
MEENYMCGIVGFVSKESKTIDIVVEGLKSLEYRGYDSCGVALVNDGVMGMFKAKGKIINLEAKLKNNDIPTNCAIGHTRWATHGEPNEINAHPHQMEDVTLVHNGIIENSDELKDQLQKLGFVFKTQTDTEVAAAVLSGLLREEKDKVKVMHRANDILRGSYAFAIIFKDEPETVYCIKKDAPLILGKGKDIIHLASDVSAFLAYTNMVIELNDGEIAKLNNGSLTIFDNDCNIIIRNSEKTNLTLQDIKKDGYDTFLLKEIHEEPAVIKKTISHYMGEDLYDLMDTMPELTKYNRAIFIGCGSAMHAGMVGKYLMEKYARVISSLEIASEFRYSNPILDEKTLCIFVSQSGETADTLAALRMCNQMGLDTIAVCNVLGSSISKEAKYFLPTLAGKEISVATTKAYTAQVAVLSLIVLKKAISDNKLEPKDKREIEKELRTLPKLLASYLDNTEVEKFASLIQNTEHAFFIGRGVDFALSLEGSLKLKEISYIHSEAYPAGELKHGTISLIEQGTPVIALITEEKLVEKTISNMKEVKARGAAVLLMIREDLYNEQIEADKIILLPKLHTAVQSIVSVIPYQMLAYHIATARGCDIDQPRNLAKSVTVE